jgi:hypothetical protein
MKLHAYCTEWLKYNQHTPFLMLRGLVCLEWFVITEYSLIKMKAVRDGEEISYARERGRWQSAEEEI